jgi:hypothetical protein
MQCWNCLSRLGDWLISHVVWNLVSDYPHQHDIKKIIPNNYFWTVGPGLDAIKPHPPIDGFEAAILQSIHTLWTTVIHGDTCTIDCHVFCFGSSNCSDAQLVIRSQDASKTISEEMHFECIPEKYVIVTISMTLMINFIWWI